MKIYIAGKITGDRHYRRKFAKAERQLKKLGHAVMNPARLGNYDDFSWRDYMAVSSAMQQRCEAVLFLPGWHDSKGAREEYRRAVKLSQRVFSDIRTVQLMYSLSRKFFK